MKLEPYLFFDGEAADALEYYARVLGGEITSLMRRGEAPGAEALDDAQKQHVMHATFTAPGITFMASDGEQEGQRGSGRIRLSIGIDDAAQGATLFAGLADGGAVLVPFEKQFWGDTFGMCRDRFGIEWMINASPGRG